MSTPDTAHRWRVGLLATFVVAALYGGMALTVDFSRAAVGVQSDEATYYLMGYSLARDGDLEYRQEDLQRGFRDFPSGPSGIFLKRGVDVRGVTLTTRPPFFEIRGVPDPDTHRLYFGKSFAYPLAAAPFVRLFDTNGFLVLNALLIAVAFLAAYLFVSARSSPATGLLLASAFVFASVVPVYAVWIMPELFNFSLGVVAYFLWLYKYVATDPPVRGEGWLRRPWTDFAAAGLIGLLTFSKVTNVLLLPPIVGWLLWRRAWKRTAVVAGAWALVTVVFFGANVVSSGAWNYQGGDRATCYGTYPFQTPTTGLEVCAERGRSEALTKVIFDRDVFWTNLRANLEYFVVGRYGGLVAYYFPAIFAVAAFLLARGRRELWQWLVLAGLAVHGLVFIVMLPYTYIGGGGSVGNRYFMGAYGAALFLLPPIRSLRVAVWPWIVGGLFTAKMVLTPFETSIRPGDHAAAGPFRLLPVELTNVNDLPINVDASRVRLWYGDSGHGDPGFQIYYLDDNSYLAEADKLSFWTRGESRAEMLVKTDRPYRRLRITLTAGPVATNASIRLNGHAVDVPLAARQSSIVQLDLGPGFPYKKDRDLPAYVWVLSVSSSAGFAPAVTDGSVDRRFLGVRVMPVIVP